MPSTKSRGYLTRSRLVCDAVAAGRTLEEVCGQPGFPQARTVRAWLLASPDFRRQFARARKLNAERLAEQVVELADSLKDGASEAETRRQRLRIEARKWMVARMTAQPFVEADEEAAAAPPPRFTAD